MSNVGKPIYECNACSCVCACVCVWIAALLCCHRETMCAAAAAKEGPPKPGLTWSDSSVYLSLALTADRWIALIHRRKNRQRESGGGWGGEGWRERKKEREREREKAPRMIRQHCSLFRGPVFDWVLHRIINPPLPSAVPSFLSLLISPFPLPFSLTPLLL